jgi:hypothetical protein
MKKDWQPCDFAKKIKFSCFLQTLRFSAKMEIVLLRHKKSINRKKLHPQGQSFFDKPLFVLCQMQEVREK